MNPDDGHEFIVGHLQKRAIVGVPRIVDQRMERAKFLDALRDEIAGSITGADIAGVDRSAAALFGDFITNRSGGFEVNVVHEHRCALLGEVEAVPPADSAPTPGDRRRPSFQYSHGVTPLSCPKA
jgi:hypothetical protein